VLEFVLGRPIHDIASILVTIAITAGIFWVIYQISAGKWIGGGDVKLGLLTGLLIGFPAGGFLYLFFASVLGVVWVLPQMATKKVSYQQKVPFGPFLITSTVLVVLFGQRIIDWYSQTLLGL
jgi:prepilin signal peptidase PulO-like enzyme (type II secretory pathway)